MPVMSRQSRGYWTSAATFCVIWSLGFPVAKMAVAVCPPELFLAMRFLVASAMMLGWAAWRGYLTASVPWLGLAGLGLVSFAMTNGLAWVSLRWISAGLSTIIASSQPVLVGIFGALLLSDHLKLGRIVGLVLGVGGVAFVVRNRIVLGGEDAFGVALMVASVASQATGTILYKRWSPRVPLTVLVGTQQLAAGIAMLVLGLATESTQAIVLGKILWMTLAYTTFLNSIVTFQLWFAMLARGSATAVASLQFIMPPLGLIFSWLLLGESIMPIDLAGIVPIALGIWLTTRPR